MSKVGIDCLSVPVIHR